MARVTIENVSKEYGTVRAVDAVSFTVENEQLVVLVGPSGCGKTTLLRMIAGLEPITSGQVLIGDKVVTNVAPRDRDVAMVFQSYALYPHMSVYENMAFGLKLRRYPKPEIDARVRTAAETLGLTPYLDRKPRALSGGQRQRVAVGRAIVRQPQVFLFDEPLSNLDAALRVHMRTEINELHNRLKATMIYVTHDQVEAMTLADKIVVMRSGRVEQADSPLELYHRPANHFVAGFIGSPAMNFVAGRVEGSAGQALTFNTSGSSLPLPPAAAAELSAFQGRDLILGVRPEDIDRNGSAATTIPTRVRVTVVEPMGSETFVHFRLGESPLLARLDGDRVPHVGEEMEIHIDLSRSHLFDAATGAALWHGGSVAVVAGTR
jgi:multiple sugar transport system ATP-binding protein